MKKNYQALSGINLELFYAVTIYEYNVKLQGEQSNQTTKYLSQMFNVSNWRVTESGYIETSFEIDGIKIDVTLT